MIRVAKNGGYVFFDIMNANSREIKILHIKAKTIGKLFRIISNLVRAVKGEDVENVLWALHFPETPTSPFYLNKYFMENKIDYLFGSSDNFVFTKNNKEAVTKKRLTYIIRKK